MRHGTALRRGLFLIAIAVLGTAAAEAQERQFGARVGAAIASLDVDPRESDGYRVRAGATGGAFLVLPLTSGLAAQLEGLYTQKGGKLDVPGVEETASVLVDYLEFPLLLRAGTPRRGGIAVHAFAGPAPGVRVSAKRQLSYSSGGITSGVSEDIGHEIRRFELSVVAGAGLDIHPRVVIDGRYAWGLTRIDEDAGDGFSVRTRVLSITAGVRF